MLRPIYQEHGRTYLADTCTPLVTAARGKAVRLSALSRGHYPGRKLPRGALPGLKSVGYWDAVAEQDWGLDWHRNEGIEFTFLESGSSRFAVDQKKYSLLPDDLTVTRPWQQHRVGDPRVGVGRLHWVILDVGIRRPHQSWRWPAWIILTPADLRQLTLFLRQNEQPVWHADVHLRRCFQHLAQAVDRDVAGSQVSRLAVLLNELFLSILEIFRGRKVRLDESLFSARRTVALFWNDLRQNLEHLGGPWNVTGMARHCGMGVTHFIRQTKQIANVTPARFLLRCRLEAAAKLLRQSPAESVTQVALRCGFGSGQYFATQFRRAFGYSPRAYRQDRTVPE
ncbi:MAG: helix-turn-helix transcriptional regulator [Pirellulales bacterium]|nr:helix-turn-helix transcriptional regulator [Pirellulales bacterium]